MNIFFVPFVLVDLVVPDESRCPNNRDVSLVPPFWFGVFVHSNGNGTDWEVPLRVPVALSGTTKGPSLETQTLTEHTWVLRSYFDDVWTDGDEPE